MFSDEEIFNLVPCRTAGLPQYGQLGHGTDNEVYLAFHAVILLDVCLVADAAKKFWRPIELM